MSRCPTCGRVGVIWPREAIIEALREWTEKHGHAPSMEDWHKAKPGHPTAHTVRRVFGTFDAARRAAGLLYTRKNSAGDWDEAKVRQAIFEWVFRHGCPPKQREWMRPPVGASWPATSVVRKLFGSWNAAIISAGYPPHRRYRPDHSYRRDLVHARAAQRSAEPESEAA